MYRQHGKEHKCPILFQETHDSKGEEFPHLNHSSQLSLACLILNRAFYSPFHSRKDTAIMWLQTLNFWHHRLLECSWESHLASWVKWRKCHICLAGAQEETCCFLAALFFKAGRQEKSTCCVSYFRHPDTHLWGAEGVKSFQHLSGRAYTQGVWERVSIPSLAWGETNLQLSC